MAVVETQLEHVALTNDQMNKKLDAAIAAITRVEKRQEAIDNQFKGGKFALSGMLAAAAVIGGSISWLLKEVIPALMRGN